METPTPKRPRGRPAGTGHGLTAALGTIQITEEQLRAIDAYCERVGRSKAEVTRHLWSLALSGAVPPPEK